MAKPSDWIVLVTTNSGHVTTHKFDTTTGDQVRQEAENLMTDGVASVAMYERIAIYQPITETKWDNYPG